VAEIILVCFKGAPHNGSIWAAPSVGTAGYRHWLWKYHLVLPVTGFYTDKSFFFLVAFLLDSLQVLVGMFRTMLLCVAMQKFISI